MLLVPVRGNKLTHSMIYLRAQFMPFIPSSLLESLFFGQRCPSSLFSDRLLGKSKVFNYGAVIFVPGKARRMRIAKAT